MSGFGRRRLRGEVAAVVVAVAAMLCGGAARAAEPTVEVGAGGLVYAGQQMLVTRREEIVISVNRVSVAYAVLNAAPEPRTALMAFALPELDMMALEGSLVENAAYDPLNPLNFVGFAALIDGQPAETFAEVRALSLGLVEATAKLRENALPLYPLLADLPVRIAALPAPVRADLQAQSLIRLNDGQYEPQWSLKTTLYWQQAFAAGQTRQIAISYRPISGSSPWTAETAAALQQRFCIAADVVAKLNQRASATQPAIVRWVSYLATAGANARGTAASLRIAIETGANQSAHTCFTGLAGANALKPRESVQTDMISDEDIQVLFVD